MRLEFHQGAWCPLQSSFADTDDQNPCRILPCSGGRVFLQLNDNHVTPTGTSSDVTSVQVHLFCEPDQDTNPAICIVATIRGGHKVRPLASVWLLCVLVWALPKRM